MTILFKTGTWTSRTSTGTDVITGLGFQPKIIIVFSSADFNTDDTFAADYNFRIGVAVDTTAANQKAGAVNSVDNVINPNSTERTWTTGVALRSVGGTTCKGSISAIGTDGFTVNWTIMDGSAHHLNYICIGGTDITNTKTAGLTAPASASSVAYTGIGFKPDFLMLWGSLIGVADDLSQSGLAYGLGFATATNQMALAGASQNGLPVSTVTKRYQRSDNVICFVELNHASPTTGALGGTLTSLDVDGFTINWSTAVSGLGASSKFGYLAVKGGSWKVGSETSKTSTGTKATTGLAFQPNGLILASVCNSSSTAIVANNRLSFGGGSSSSNNRCVWTGDTDNTSAGSGNSITAEIQKSAKCISINTEAATHTSSTVNAEASISTLDATGFTLNWSTASATAYEFIYVAVGGGAAAQNITKTLTETVTIGTTIPTRTKSKQVTKTLTESLTIGAPTPTRPRGKLRSPAAESISLAGTVDSLILTSTGKKKLSRAMPVQTITFDDTNLTYIRTGRRDIVKTLTESIHISESVNYIGKTKHTGDPGYWLPLKPRIKIYAFTDSSYSTPLYTYDAFTDAGTTDKPIGLQFESVSTSAGTFSLQIDNSADTYDLDMFSRGNRVTVECSKDGVVWSSAFRGLVRSAKQKVFGPNNRIIYIEGYSYLIRLNERILSVKKQAALVGGNYDRTDSTMFSDNLINNLLTVDTNYVHTVDDTQLYSIFKTSNITASPIDDWVPRLDVQLAPIDEAISSVLEFSQSFLTIDVSNDQVVMFNPDRVPSGGANAFLVTDVLSLQGDSSLNTMYPTSDYTYEISYDFADSANRLISAIGSVRCPPQTIPGTDIPGTVGSVVYANNVSQPTGNMGAAIYDLWTVAAAVQMGPNAGPANTRIGIQFASGAAALGYAPYRINIAFTTPDGGGTVRVGIRKASNDAFIQFATPLDIATIPHGTMYTGYTFDNPYNAYAIQLGDHVSVESTNITGTVGVAILNGGSPYIPAQYYGASGWATGGLASYYITAQIYANNIDASNWGTVQVNNGTVRRLAILLAAGSAMVGVKLGRITLSLRTNGTSPNGTFWVGIRKADNTFVYFGPGIIDTTTIDFNDEIFRDYSFDNLDNQYACVAGDRISIEVSGMTQGYLEFQATLDGGSPNTVQVYNGTSYVTTGVTSFRLGATISLTTASTTPDTNIDPCGGLPETEDADPLLAIAVDANMAKRIGMVEQVVSNIPPHVKKFQSMQEFLFNKLYVMARPRFTFDYPSLTLPSIMPKAGDICAHISKKAGIGVRRGVVQTGVITEVTYDFGQDSDSILGLRRLSIQTNGVLRGSY